MDVRPALAEPLPAEEPTPPEHAKVPLTQWIKENLFNSRFNAALTIVFAVLIGFAAWRAIRFLFVTARWDVVERNLTNFMVGFFPRDQLWRPWAAVFILTLVIGLRWGAAVGKAGVPHVSLRTGAARVWPLAAFAVVILAFSRSARTALLLVALVATVLIGRALGGALPGAVRRRAWIIMVIGILAAYQVITGFGGVGYDRWRGLLLTMFLAIGGIVLSFPFGVLLALGRRSSFPAIRTVCVGYIELIRGVPLITLLFMAFLILGFFLPPGSGVPSLVSRVLVALVLFTAAYLAEIVRGGLQSVPKGQIEAAQALGLSPLTITFRIVLPQALRAVIPAIVGQFISLFKDTSLVGFVGLTELLGVAQQVTKQPDFVGKGVQAETLAFAAFVYWVGAYWMSRTSQRLEKRLGVGER